VEALQVYDNRSFSLALRLHSALRAASHATHCDSEKDGRSRKPPARHVRRPAVPSRLHDGRTAGLRRRKRWNAATTSPSSIHKRCSGPDERLGLTGKLADICRDGHKHDRLQRDLEREWRSRRNRIQRNYHNQRGLHGAR
jgi:hypothetical protein